MKMMVIRNTILMQLGIGKMVRLPVPIHNCTQYSVGSEALREHYYNTRPQSYNRKPATGKWPVLL